MREMKGYVTAPDGVRLFFQKLGSGLNATIVPNALHMFDSFKHLAGNRTVIFFDLRNRGNSDSVDDREKLGRGIHHDVDDIAAPVTAPDREALAGLRVLELGGGHAAPFAGRLLRSGEWVVR